MLKYSDKRVCVYKSDYEYVSFNFPFFDMYTFVIHENINNLFFEIGLRNNVSTESIINCLLTPLIEHLLYFTNSATSQLTVYVF